MNQCLHGGPGVNPWFDWRLKKKKSISLLLDYWRPLFRSFLALPFPNQYCSVMDGLMGKIWNYRLAAVSSKDVGCWMNKTATSLLKWGWALVTCRWIHRVWSAVLLSGMLQTASEDQRWAPSAVEPQPPCFIRRKYFQYFYGQTNSKELIFGFLKARARYALGSFYRPQSQISLQIFSIFLW